MHKRRQFRRDYSGHILEHLEGNTWTRSIVLFQDAHQELTRIQNIVKDLCIYKQVANVICCWVLVVRYTYIVTMALTGAYDWLPYLASCPSLIGDFGTASPET